MPLRVRSIIIVCELLTAIGYVVLTCWRYFDDIVDVSLTIDELAIVSAALVVSWAAWRDRQVTLKATVILAAFVGLPNFTMLAGRVRGIIDASKFLEAALWTLLPLIAIAQLIALLTALSRLTSRDAAA